MTTHLSSHVPLKWRGRLDFAGAIILCVGLFTLGAPNGLLVLIAALAWCFWAKVSEVSMTLVTALLWMSVPVSQEAALPFFLYGVSACGVLPWALCEIRKDRATAFISGLLWSGMAILLQGCLPLVFCGYPRLSRVYPLAGGWTRWPGIVLLRSCLVWVLISGQTPDDFQRIGDPDHYRDLFSGFMTWGLSLDLWAVIPFVGLFEIAQKQTEDIRTTWRSLPLLGVLLSACLVTSTLFLPLLAMVAFPLASLILTRWSYTLHSIWLRRLYWCLLTASALFHLR